jgi:hypothetical protein
MTTLCLIAGKHMTSDSDFTHASMDAGTAYIVMLAIDSMLAIITGLEALTLEAVQSSKTPGMYAESIRGWLCAFITRTWALVPTRADSMMFSSLGCRATQSAAGDQGGGHGLPSFC